MQSKDDTESLGQSSVPALAMPDKPGVGGGAQTVPGEGLLFGEDGEGRWLLASPVQGKRITWEGLA